MPSARLARLARFARAAGARFAARTPGRARTSPFALGRRGCGARGERVCRGDGAGGYVLGQVVVGKGVGVGALAVEFLLRQLGGVGVGGVVAALALAGGAGHGGWWWWWWW